MGDPTQSSMFGIRVIVDIMVNPSRLYEEAEANGRTFSSLLQQRLDTSAAHDIDGASVEMNYRLELCPEWPGMSNEQDNAFENKNIELEGDDWTSYEGRIRNCSPSCHTAWLRVTD